MKLYYLYLLPLTIIYLSIWIYVLINYRPHKGYGYWSLGFANMWLEMNILIAIVVSYALFMIGITNII